MTEFDLSILVKPEKSRKLWPVLHEFWEWQTHINFGIDANEHDWVGLAKPMVVTKDNLDVEPLGEDDTYAHHVMKWQEKCYVVDGYEFWYWDDILYPTNWPKSLVQKLIKSCNKHDCNWFLKELEKALYDDWEAMERTRNEFVAILGPDNVHFHYRKEGGHENR